MNEKRMKTKHNASIEGSKHSRTNVDPSSRQKVKGFGQNEFNIYEEDEPENGGSSASHELPRKRLKRVPLQEIDSNQRNYRHEEQYPHYKKPSMPRPQNSLQAMKVCAESIYENRITNHMGVQTELDSASCGYTLPGTKLESLIIRSSQLQYTKFKAKYSPSYKDVEELIPLEAYPFMEVSIRVAVALDNPLFRSGIIRLSRGAETIPQRASKGILKIGTY
jgi:hypothetical protein